METRTVVRSFAIGVTCGMRSMTGPTPARTIPPALIFRLFSGGFCGRSIAAARDDDALGGTLAGSFGALAGAYAGQALRRLAVRASGLPDPFVALFEDAAAIAGAIAASGN